MRCHKRLLTDSEAATRPSDLPYSAGSKEVGGDKQ